MSAPERAPEELDEVVETLRAQEFPILDTWTYLDCATFGPVPRSHVRAVARTAQKLSEERIEDIGASAAMDELRLDGARLLRCSPDNVAVLRSTSDGVGLVARGLDWRVGDEVILYEREFPGTIAPWEQLQRDGVRLRIVADRGRARFDVADVEALISARTRVVCVSLVNSDHGFRAPVEAIARLCRPRGIWLVVDAVQAVGTTDVDAVGLGADVVAAHGYKFLLSGFGIALAYCSPRAIEELDVWQVGWKNLPAGSAPASASRFEPTIPAVPAMAGMRASLALLTSVGLTGVQARILGLVDQLADALVDRGCEVVSSRAEGERSALLSLRHRTLETPSLHAMLLERGIACAIRDGAIRVSPHFYNQAADIERLVEALPS